MPAATGATRNYGRFLGIWEEFQQLRAADPSFDPAHPVVPAFTRQPFDVAAPQTVISDPLTARGGRDAGARLRGATAGFPFEMSYVMTNAVPARRPAWTVLHERIALLASSCEALAAEGNAPAAVREAGERAAAIAGELDAERQSF